VKPLALCCVSTILFCRIALADGYIEQHVLAEAATDSVDDPEWAQRFFERSRNAYLAAAARCSNDRKIAKARYWQNAALQLVGAYRCVARDDPELLSGQPSQQSPVANFRWPKKCAPPLARRSNERGLTSSSSTFACRPGTPLKSRRGRKDRRDAGRARMRAGSFKQPASARSARACRAEAPRQNSPASGVLRMASRPTQSGGVRSRGQPPSKATVCKSVATDGRSYREVLGVQRWIEHVPGLNHWC
jgi:hypothetical protein